MMELQRQENELSWISDKDMSLCKSQTHSFLQIYVFSTPPNRFCKFSFITTQTVETIVGIRTFSCLLLKLMFNFLHPSLSILLADLINKLIN